MKKISFLCILLTLSLFSFSSFANSNGGLAIVIIDMQLGFYERGGTTDTEGLNNLVKKQRKLIQWGMSQDIPIMVLEYQNFGETDPLIMGDLNGYEHAVITKNRDGGFDGMSELKVLETLKKWNVDTIIIAGINGCCCVYGTARGAIKHNYDVITSSDIIGNINHNPPTYPNSSWYFESNKIAYFDSLSAIID